MGYIGPTFPIVEMSLHFRISCQTDLLNLLCVCVFKIVGKLYIHMISLIGQHCLLQASWIDRRPLRVTYMALDPLIVDMVVVCCHCCCQGGGVGGSCVTDMQRTTWCKREEVLLGEFLVTIWLSWWLGWQTTSTTTTKVVSWGPRLA